MKEVINTSLAPSPIGPYNQAVRAGNMLFVSGQIAIIPETGTLVEGDIHAETTQVMANIEAILKASGFGFSDVVKTSIFLSDMGLFVEVNTIYATYFDENAPARETIAAKELPKNVNVEISVIAYKA